MIKEIRIFNKALIGTLILTLIISVVLFFVTRNENGETKSLIIGSIASLLLNYYHVKTILKYSKKNIKKLKSYVVFSYILRYSIYGLLIFLSVEISSFNPIYIMFGILIYPTMTFVMSFSLIKGDKNDIS